MNPALMLMDLCLVQQAFKEVGGEMFLLYGTALGAYRDGGFLPGDEDLDIGSFNSRLRDKVANRLRESGFQIDIAWDENIHDYRESAMIHGKHDVHIDIFFFKKTKEGWVAPRAVEEEPFVMLPPWTTKTFQPVSISGRDFQVLSPVEKHLEYLYDDWRNPAKRDHGKLYHHLKGEEFPVTIFK